MDDGTKGRPIRFSAHATGQLAFRGASKEEIIDAIKTSPWLPAGFGRLECGKNFTFEKVWNNKRYDIKQVKPIFAEESDEIVVITVYVYYF